MAIFTNQATLSYNGNTVNSNTVTGNILAVLAVTKTAVRREYQQGETITYIVSITNTGSTPITGITLTDNLGEYEFGSLTLTPLDYVQGTVVYYQNGVLQPAPLISQTNPLTITNITVPAGGNAMVIYEAEANNFAPLEAESTITNEVILTSQNITTPLTAEETISVSDEPELTITKALSPETVAENSEITYTLTIQNTGNTAADATDNIVITDTFDPVLSNIIVTVNGAVLPATSYTYNETTGEFAIDPGVVTVPAATFVQDETTGSFVVTPGVTVVTITGTI